MQPLEFLSAAYAPCRARLGRLKFPLDRAVLRAAGNDAIASFIMRLSCPNCQIEYEVPDTALTGRSRTLRCDNCMTRWKTPALEMYRTEPAETVGALPEDAGDTVFTPRKPADAVMAAAPAVEVARGPARPSILKTSQGTPAEVEPSAKRGLAISLLLVLLMVALVLLAHRQIGHFWPPSLRLFHALGLR